MQFGKNTGKISEDKQKHGRTLDTLLKTDLNNRRRQTKAWEWQI